MRNVPDGTYACPCPWSFCHQAIQVSDAGATLTITSPAEPPVAITLPPTMRLVILTDAGLPPNAETVIRYADPLTNASIDMTDDCIEIANGDRLINIQLPTAWRLVVQPAEAAHEAAA
jgi:hypothetical protein